MRVSLAMDAVMSTVAARRTKTITALAYLCSPTDVFVIDKQANEAAAKNYKAGGIVGLYVSLLRSIIPHVRWSVENSAVEN